MAENVELSIVSAVVIDGEIAKAGAVVSVSQKIARNLLARGKAELSTAAPAKPANGNASAKAKAKPAAAATKAG